jgi:predicted DNA-binding protein
MPKMVRIRISVETRDRLRAMKRHPRETYGEVIERLLDDYEDTSPAALRRYDRIAKEVRAGEFKTNEEVKRAWRQQ